MITPEQIIKIQEEYEPDQEALYQEFKDRVDQIIHSLPEYAKHHKTSNYYAMLVWGKFRPNCQQMCDRYIRETGTKFEIYLDDVTSNVHIRWR